MIKIMLKNTSLIMTLLLTAKIAQAYTIQIFTTDDYDIVDPAYEGVICNIANTKLIIKSINKDIQESHIKDPSIIVDRYKDNFESIAASNRCLYEARALGVKAFPTIVVDKNTLFVGATNVPEVIHHYRTIEEKGEKNA